jgi:predicted small lipoprotein YifL
MFRYAMRPIFLACALTLLTACGTKTPLTLPPPPPGSPTVSKPAAAPASTSTATFAPDDSNKAAPETPR